MNERKKERERRREKRPRLPGAKVTWIKIKQQQPERHHLVTGSLSVKTQQRGDYSHTVCFCGESCYTTVMFVSPEVSSSSATSITDSVTMFQTSPAVETQLPLHPLSFYFFLLLFLIFLLLFLLFLAVPLYLIFLLPFLLLLYPLLFLLLVLFIFLCFLLVFFALLLNLNYFLF